jgi:diguanylate cyclase (GGDEF)-like protein/PAS domain S-box-containing protein
VDAEHYRQLFLDLPVGWVVHADGVVRGVNAAALDLFHLPDAGAAVGTALLDHVHPESRASVLARLQQLRETDQPVRAVAERMVRGDGEDLWVETVASLTTLQGQPAVQVLCWDVTERVHEQQRLEHAALHDALTGLPNRLLLEEQWQHLLAAGQRAAVAPAVLSCDVDAVKAINDTRGHAAGDEVLKAVALRLRQVLRTEDTVGRFGGDEFVALLQARPAEPDELVERIRQSVRAPVITSAGPVDVALSLGITTADGPEPLSAVLARADAAVYRAPAR